MDEVLLTIFQTWLTFTIYLIFFKFMTHAYNTIKSGIPQNMIVKWTYFCLILYLQRTFLLTYYYSMQLSPSWEANRFSASQEIPCILWNP